MWMEDTVTVELLLCYMYMFAEYRKASSKILFHKRRQSVDPYGVQAGKPISATNTWFIGN